MIKSEHGISLDIIGCKPTYYILSSNNAQYTAIIKEAIEIAEKIEKVGYFNFEDIPKNIYESIIERTGKRNLEKYRIFVGLPPIENKYTPIPNNKSR